MITLNGNPLPDGLLWRDEFSGSDIKQTVENAANGALVVQSAQLMGGRQIVLVGGETLCWAFRTTLLQLKALLATSEPMELNYHGSLYSVIPDHSQGPLKAGPLYHENTAVTDLSEDAEQRWYIDTIYLIEAPQ